VVEDERQASVLADPKALRHLTPFLGRECTVTAAARELGITPHAMLYWVKRFVALGLLTVTREQRRAGKPVKWHRSAADRFDVALRLLPSATLEELLHRDDEPWRRLLVRNIVRISVDAFGQLHTFGLSVSGESGLKVELTAGAGSDFWNEFLRPDAPAFLTGWVSVQLDFEDAKAFQGAFCALLNRDQQRAGSQRYLARVALTPVTDHRI